MNVGLYRQFCNQFTETEVRIGKDQLMIGYNRTHPSYLSHIWVKNDKLRYSNVTEPENVFIICSFKKRDDIRCKKKPIYNKMFNLYRLIKSDKYYI